MSCALQNFPTFGLRVTAAFTQNTVLRASFPLQIISFNLNKLIFPHVGIKRRRWVKIIDIRNHSQVPNFFA